MGIRQNEIPYRLTLDNKTMFITSTRCDLFK